MDLLILFLLCLSLMLVWSHRWTHPRQPCLPVSTQKVSSTLVFRSTPLDTSLTRRWRGWAPSGDSLIENDTRGDGSKPTTPPGVLHPCHPVIAWTYDWNTSSGVEGQEQFCLWDCLMMSDAGGRGRGRLPGRDYNSISWSASRSYLHGGRYMTVDVRISLRKSEG